ncbi:MAG TPA: prolyl oligopeptidase family serine peptidase [Vicinamibacteria bacterium]|nr:prolyl oligopeptidase family serine peptidase [Vicinamibacteria bacterium]
MHSLLFVILAAASSGRTPAGTPHAITIDALLDVKHPYRATWSPDGRRIAFVWDRAGVQNLWVADVAAGGPTPLTRYADGLIDGFFWGRTGESLYFERSGDLWQVAASGGAEPRAVWTTPEAESGVTPSPDGGRVVFLRNGDLWVRSLSDGGERRLTETPGAEGGAVWSPDGERVAFTVASSVPQEESPEYAGSKIAFRRQDGFNVHVGVVPVSGGPLVSVARGAGSETTPRWADATHLTLQRESADLTAREVLLADAVTGEATVLYKDIDSKWWSLDFLGAEPVPSPDGRWIAFISDRDGWDHLYLVPSSGGPAVQLTKGAYEVSRPTWSPDGKRIAFDANPGDNPGARQLMVAEVGSDPGSARLLTLTGGRGTNVGASWSPNGTRLLYQHTDPQNPADWFVLEARASATPRRLTDSLPPSLDRSSFVEPRFVRYPAPDGQQVPAYLFVPKGLDRSHRHPAIIWVHGDGITQNFDGWHVRRDYAVYYSVHQYLLQRGYVVLAVDYRGSIGYGKAWRQGPYRDLGGGDYQDIAAGVGYLKGLGYVDEKRVGIWGLSYGGYMALQALTVTPELFRCAIDVAGVEDWRDWFHDPDGPWIRGRLGSPEQNPDLYERTSPIHRVDRIVRPLLVMHGTADVNVPFLESVRLLDAGLKAGKDIDFVMYPGEFHYFHRAHVLRDAWQRVERFFDVHLSGSKNP